MNSLNKYVPMLVFAIGLAFLIFSVREFFHPRPTSEMTPLANEKPSLLSEVHRPPTVVFRSPKKAPAPVIRANPRDEFLADLKKPALEYFSSVGLKINVPDGFAFAEEADGPVKVLVGASEPGKLDFYFFSAKGKYPAARAVSYLKQYFADEMSISPKGTPEPFYSRGGFSDMSHFKGASTRGEFHAFFFTNSKSNQSHLMVLLNRGLTKAPARVRELVDSIHRAGR